MTSFAGASISCPSGGSEQSPIRAPVRSDNSVTAARRLRWKLATDGGSVFPVSFCFFLAAALVGFKIACASLVPMRITMALG